MRHSILVLGCGHIGSAITKMLGPNFQVTVVDYNIKALADVGTSGPFARTQMSFTDPFHLKEVYEKHTIIINAAPHQFNLVLGRLAIDMNKVYLDLTEDMADTTALINYVLGKGQDFTGHYFPQCGLAPGYVSIAAAHLIKEFDAAQHVHMRVGAIPQTPTNSLGYALTWSIDGLVNEYDKPGFAVRNGQEYTTTPLEEKEDIYVNGRLYEAFNTSGGVGTFGETFPILQELNYKTIRYPGHCEKMKFLMRDLRMHPEDVKMTLVRALPTTKQDMVIIKVVVGGAIGGKNHVRTIERAITPSSPNAVNTGGPYTAIQLTTAQALCSVVHLFIHGKTPNYKIVNQEYIQLEDFLDNVYGALYR